MLAEHLTMSITQHPISYASSWATVGAGRVAPSRIRITLSQLGSQLSIVSVNVIAKVNVAVLVGERRSVNDEHWNSLHEVHGDVIFSALHCLLYSLRRPSGVIAQCPRG